MAAPFCLIEVSFFLISSRLNMLEQHMDWLLVRREMLDAAFMGYKIPHKGDV